MKVVISLKKGIEGSAANYFEQSKKAKKKLEGLREAREETIKKIEKHEKTLQVKTEEKQKREMHWFEKFRWFRSSEGFLCVGGRDATTNDIVVKKHTAPGDVVFHTEIAGSPFFVVQAEKKEVSDVTKEETAIATACYSRAWRMGLPNADVFMVTPDQLSKEAPSGEYVGRGAFMVRGRRTNFNVDLVLGVGMTDDDIVMAGPVSAIEKHSKIHVRIMPGRDKTSDVAKKIRKKIGGELDEIIRVLPAGGIELR